MSGNRPDEPALRAPARGRRRPSGRSVASVALAVLCVLGAVWILPQLPPFRAAVPTPTYVTPSGPVKHVVEIMMENHAFDNFFGAYPGVDGLANASSVPNGSGGFVAPFHLLGNSTADPPHDRASLLGDLDGGAMDGFVEQMARVDPAAADTPMGYYNASQLAGLWALAHGYVLCDRYFESVLGPTVPNRLYAMAGASAGVTADLLVPGTYLPTIFDQFNRYDLSWSYFYEPNPLPVLPSLLLPLSASPEFSGDVRPVSDLAGILAAGTLPSLTFVDPEDSAVSQHPSDNISVGEAWLLNLVGEIEASPVWNSTVVFVTWDEGGGFYDHVVPPTVDALGDGFRVPMLVVSPYSAGGGVDATTFDHTSVLHFVENAWGLPYLTPRVAAAGDLCSTLTGLPAGERCQSGPPLPAITAVSSEPVPSSPGSSSGAPTSPWVATGVGRSVERRG